VREEEKQKAMTEDMAKKRKLLISVGAVLVVALVVVALIISRARSTGNCSLCQSDIQDYGQRCLGD